jgi:hypothetical protein
MAVPQSWVVMAIALNNFLVFPWEIRLGFLESYDFSRGKPVSRAHGDAEPHAKSSIKIGSSARNSTRSSGELWEHRGRKEVRTSTQSDLVNRESIRGQRARSGYDVPFAPAYFFLQSTLLLEVRSFPRAQINLPLAVPQDFRGIACLLQCCKTSVVLREDCRSQESLSTGRRPMMWPSS